VFVDFLATAVALVGFYAPIGFRSLGILCGPPVLPQSTCGTGTHEVVIGRRNRS
jgi:hypothetical protein